MTFYPESKIAITQEKAEQLRDYSAEPGDLLISRSGTVGEVCVVPNSIRVARISTNVIRVALRPGGMDPEFLGFLFLGCPEVREQISRACSGSTRDFLNKRILCSLLFPLPSVAEQREILARIKSLWAVVDGLAQQVTEQDERLSELDVVTLRKAFRGELVPQDPADEPASVLLERIRVQRAPRAPRTIRSPKSRP